MLCNQAVCRCKEGCIIMLGLPGLDCFLEAWVEPCPADVSCDFLNHTAI